MFPKPKPKPPTLLEKEIERVMHSLSNHMIDSEEYSKMVDQLAKLHKLKEEEKPSQVHPDTWAMIGANLVGIMLIIRHEHVNVISSKAMGLVMKPR